MLSCFGIYNPHNVSTLCFGSAAMPIVWNDKHLAYESSTHETMDMLVVAGALRPPPASPTSHEHQTDTSIDRRLTFMLRIASATLIV